MRRIHKDDLNRARILVRTPNWLGDAVMCLPALQALRRALPEADLVLVARPWVLDLFPLEELRCKAVAYDTQDAHRGLLGRWRIASALRKGQFQAAILFQNAFDAALLAVLSGIRVRAGYARDGRRLLLTHAIQVPPPGAIPPHEAHYYLELLRRLGLIEDYPEVREITLPATEGGREGARENIARLAVGRKQEALEGAIGACVEKGPIVGISPGAAYGTAKRWHGARFAELARKLSTELGAVPVFFGSKDEAPLAESLLREAGESAISFAGKTSLSDFMRLIAGCDLYVTNDTGAMHVAAALGVPTLAIFGPTDERATRPLGARVRLLVGYAECRPCLLRHCPIDHRCMNSVSVEEVFEAALSLLERRSELPLVHQNHVR